MANSSSSENPSFASLGHDLTAYEHVHPVTQAPSELGALLSDDHRCAEPVADLGEPIAECIYKHRSKAQSRLVNQQELRLGRRPRPIASICCCSTGQS